MSPPTTLREEIQQRRPFRSAKQEATLGLLRTADVVRRHFSQVLEPAGITQQQYNVLRILRGAGVDGLPTLSIIDRLLERTPGITRLIDRLEKKGWVERRRDTTDRRQVVCTINAAGLKLLDELDPVMDRADDECMATLEIGEQRMLIELLDKVRSSYRG